MSIYLKKLYFTQYIIGIIDFINDIDTHLENEQLCEEDINSLQCAKANFLVDIGQHIVEQWHYR